MPAAGAAPVTPATLLLPGAVGWAWLSGLELLVVSFPSGPNLTAPENAQFPPCPGSLHR